MRLLLFARCWLAVTLDQYRASFAIAHQPGPRLLGRALLAQLLPGPRNATLAVLVPLALVPFVLALFVLLLLMGAMFKSLRHAMVIVLT